MSLSKEVKSLTNYLQSFCVKQYTAAVTAFRHRCHQNQSNVNVTIMALSITINRSAFILSHMTHISPELLLSAALASSSCSDPLRAAPLTVTALSQNQHKRSTTPQSTVLNSLSNNKRPASCNVVAEQRV